MENPTHLRKMKKSALRLVKSKYTPEMVADKLEEVYKEGLERYS